jgi:hypothetical protein
MSITFSGSRSGSRSGPGSGGRSAPSRLPAFPAGSGRPLRRVRHEVRDGFAVAAFSAASSTALAGAMVLLVRLAG